MTSIQRKINEAAKLVGKMDLSQLQQDNDPTVSKKELDSLESLLDNMFAKIGIDIEFTRHFLDRVNDKRNGEQITLTELQSLFAKTFQKYSNVLSKADVDWQAVLKDLATDINSPVVLNYDKKKGLQLVTKTIMRKKNFKSPNQFLKV